MRLCTRGAVFGAYLVINARHATAPFTSVLPLITANAGPLTFITKMWKSFVAAVAPSFVRVALLLVTLMSELVAVSSAPASGAGKAQTTETRSFSSRNSIRSIRPPFHCRLEASPVSADLHLWQSNECRQHTAPVPPQHYCDVGESHSWMCDCRCDASGSVDKAQTELRPQHGCDSWETTKCTSSCENCTHCNRDR